MYDINVVRRWSRSYIEAEDRGKCLGKCRMNIKLFLYVSMKHIKFLEENYLFIWYLYANKIKSSDSCTFLPEFFKTSALAICSMATI